MSKNSTTNQTDHRRLYRIQEAGLCVVLLAGLIGWFVFGRQQPISWNGPGSDIAQRVQHYDARTQAEIDNIWKRIENYVRERQPERLTDFGAPATDSQIAELEYALGFGLPGDLKASLKRHAACRQFFSIWDLMDLKRIADNYKMGATHYDQFPTLMAVEKLRADDFWHPSLVPFAGWDADLLCVHLESGRVLSYSGDGGTSFESASYRQWLQNIADRLEAGDHKVFDICGDRWPEMLSPGADPETFETSTP